MKDDDIVVVGDDNVAYSSTFIEDMVSGIQDSPPGAILTGELDGDLRFLTGFALMGFSGVACKAGMLRKLTKMPSRSCFLADDIVVTHYANQQGFRKVHLLKRAKDGSSEISHDSTSIYAFHKKHGMSINRQCIWDLMFQ